MCTSMATICALSLMVRCVLCADVCVYVFCLNMMHFYMLRVLTYRGYA